MKKFLTLLTVAVFMVGCAAMQGPEQSSASGELDYGDYSSQVLTTNAWNSLNAGDYLTAIKYTDKCIEMYEERAVEMQTSMKDEVASQGKKPANEVHANWALNDVGTSYFIRGEALQRLGRDEEALVAYKAVMDSFYYAQTWDPQGWFWSPSAAAGEKVLALSEDF